MLLTSWQATTFLVGEYSVEYDPNPIVTLADGLLWLHQSVHRPRALATEGQGKATTKPTG